MFDPAFLLWPPVSGNGAAPRTSRFASYFPQRSTRMICDPSRASTGYPHGRLQCRHLKAKRCRLRYSSFGLSLFSFLEKNDREDAARITAINPSVTKIVENPIMTISPAIPSCRNDMAAKKTISMIFA